MKIVLWLMLLAYGSTMCAQSIKKGDVFDYTTKLKFQHALEKTISIPELRGQHVILDFFGTGCIVCFKSMPKVNALQQKYAGKVQFLLIGKQDGQIESIYEKVRKRAGLELAVAFDSILFRKLKIKSVPIYVWIKPDGKVFTVSYPTDLTCENIDRFIAGESFVSEREKEKIPYSRKRPMLLQGNGGPDSIYLMRSVLSRWTPDQVIDYTTGIPSKSKSFQAMGITVERLFMLALIGNIGWFTDKPYYGQYYERAIIKLADSIRFTKDYYNYSLEVPDTGIRPIMKQQLEQFFGVTARLEKRMIPCWTLVLKDKDTSKVASRDTQFSGTVNIAGADARGFHIDNVIFTLMVYLRSELAIINKTGIKGRINLKMDADMTNIKEVQQELRKNGLDLVKIPRRLKVVVIEKAKREE